MPVLKNKTERGGLKRNIGGYFPTHIDDYLTLWSLANAVTKSSILFSLLDKWVASARAKDSEKQLTEKITQRISSQWRIEKGQPPFRSLEEYKDKVRTELLSKGLSEDCVNKILKSIQR